MKIELDKNAKKILWLPISLAIVVFILVGCLFFLKTPEVKITNINSGQEISGEIVVEGRALGNWFFEAQLPIRITDEQGNILGSSYVTAQGEWMTDKLVNFKGSINYQSKTGGKGFLVVAKDNPSGLLQYDKEIKIPIILKPSGYTTVKVYFSNNNLDPEVSCIKVFPVEREITKVDAIGSAAINELLKGPTNYESEQGYYGNINSGVKLLSLNIDKNGIATADFDQKLQEGVGGSCKVGAIKAQIEQTLMQFPTVESVIISINGNSEEVLQP